MKKEKRIKMATFGTRFNTSAFKAMKRAEFKRLQLKKQWEKDK
tara:strand:+ start:748 stop:876 length:129 start_codon:yes stop_codon:yes gene_type:complete